MLSFNEFKQETYKIYSSLLLAFNKNEIDSYFNSQEAKETLRSEYNHALTKSKEEKEDYTLSVAYSCGYCLSLMFE